MSERIRVLVWATTFQSDIQAVAHHLAEQTDFDVLVAMARPELWRREPIERLMPFHGRVVDQGTREGRREAAAFGADVVLVDNHLPPARLAPRMLVIWHGFGWRVDDLATMRRELIAHVGDVTRPNSCFLWSAFGDQDRKYRIEHSKLAAENVRALGAPVSDLLRPESKLARAFDRRAVQEDYKIDLTRKVVLVGLTWHHGGALAHWGDDAELFERFVAHVEGSGASVLVRMHDRQRYDATVIKRMQQLVQRHPGIELKFKDEHPDSLVDLLVADVLVSNYSSLLNLFYYTGKPTIHIDPVDANAPFLHRSLRRGRVKAREVSREEFWKLEPSDNGGLQASDFDELLAHTRRALVDPTCCADRAREFVARHITSVDGGTCRRIADLLRER